MYQTRYYREEMDKDAEPAPSASIADLYQRHASTLFTYMKLHLATQEDAEDLLAEVFISAVQSENLLALSEDHQRRWLWRVAHNKVNDYHRRKARRPIFLLEEEEAVLYDDDELQPEQVATRSEEIAELLISIRSLPEIQQEILYLRFVKGLRSTAIAERLGKQDGAVRTLLSRTLNRLRDIYTKAKEFPHA